MHDRTESNDTRAIRRHLRLVTTIQQEPAQTAPADPWAELDAHPEITFLRWPLPAGTRGRYYRSLDAIVMTDGLDAEQERVTLWHELIHAERGHDGSISDAEHEAVDREAHARAGVPFRAAPVLIEALSGA